MLARKLLEVFKCAEMLPYFAYSFPVYLTLYFKYVSLLLFVHLVLPTTISQLRKRIVSIAFRDLDETTYQATMVDIIHQEHGNEPV